MTVFTVILIGGRAIKLQAQEYKFGETLGDYTVNQIILYFIDGAGNISGIFRLNEIVGIVGDNFGGIY